MVSHTGLIAVSGHLITWLPHKVKATATITISGDPCYRMIEDLEARVTVYLPLIVR